MGERQFSNFIFSSAEFAGKVAVVTGAAQGIGKAVVNALEQAGARVAQLDIQFAAGTDGQDQRKFAVDIADSSAVDTAMEDIETNLGDIDYLVNAAGILRMASIVDSGDEDWDKTFAVNSRGAFNVCRAVARKMLPRRRGVIVVVGSNAAGVPRIGMGSYAASKAATAQMVKCLGLELAAANIRCNIVAPGSTDTEMQRQLWINDNGPQTVIDGSLQSYRLGIPLKRIAMPENIADAVMFLLSSAAVHITLETLVVDGGATLGC